MTGRGQTLPAAFAYLLLAVASCERPPNHTTPPVLHVSATRGWQDTGIFVQPGAAFTLQNVTGRIRDQETEINGGMGSDYVCGSAGCCEPLPRERRSALIGRVGSDAFLVGRGTEHTPTSGGRLLLRVNDCDEGLYDNAGELTVEFVPNAP